MLKIRSVGDLPQNKVQYINNELQLKYNIQKTNNENLYEFSQEIYYDNKEIVPYLINQLNTLSKIVFELFKHIDINKVDNVGKDIILNGFIEMWKHDGITKEQFKELTSMLNKESKNIRDVNKNELLFNLDFSIDEDLEEINTKNELNEVFEGFKDEK